LSKQKLFVEKTGKIVGIFCIKKKKKVVESSEKRRLWHCPKFSLVLGYFLLFFLFVWLGAEEWKMFCHKSYKEEFQS